MTNFRLFVLLTILLAVISEISAERKLLQIISIIRHGARFPQQGKINKYLKDQNLPGTDENIQGRLTGNGLKMSYLLGQKMAKAYEAFRPDVTQLKDLYKLSASNLRSQLTGQAFFAGFFGNSIDTAKFDLPGRLHSPPFGGLVTDDSGLTGALPDSYYPIPVDMVSDPEKKLFDPFDTHECTKFAEFGGNVEHLGAKYYDPALATIDSSQILRDLVKEVFDQKVYENVKNQWELYLFVDYLVSMKNLGVTFGIDESVLDSLHLSSAIIGSMFHFEGDALKVQTTNLINLIESNMDDVQGGEEGKYKKMVMLFGHDINIWAFLNVFGQSSSHCLQQMFDHLNPPNCRGPPDFAAALVFEVYKEDDNITIGKISILHNINPKIKQLMNTGFLI